MKSINIREVMEDATFYFHTFMWKEDAAVFCRLAESDHRVHSSNSARAAREVYAVPLADLLNSREYATTRHGPVHYIFMTDFCGSTLLARALGSLEGLFCYNEPRGFVSLSNEKRRIDFCGRGDLRRWIRALPVAVRLMSRTFRAGDVALVKEQPLTNYIAHELLASHPNSRALFMYSSLADYLAAVCRQPRRRAYVRHRMLHNFHETQLHAPLAGIDKTSLGDMQIAALHWLTQVCQYAELVKRIPECSMRSIRSDMFFANPAAVLCSAVNFYGVKCNSTDIDFVVNGELFGRHSKQVDRPFNADMQQQQATRSATAYAVEIAAGIDWAQSVMGGVLPESLPRALSTDR